MKSISALLYSIHAPGEDRFGLHVQFSGIPIVFLRKLTGLRRKEPGFLPTTNLGWVLQQRKIPDKEFDQQSLELSLG